MWVGILEKTPRMWGLMLYLTLIAIEVFEIDFPSINQQSSIKPISLKPTLSNNAFAFLLPLKTPKSIQCSEGSSRHH